LTPDAPRARLKWDEAAPTEPEPAMPTKPKRLARSKVDASTSVTPPAASGSMERPESRRRAGRRPGHKVADLSSAANAADTPTRSGTPLTGAKEKSAMRSIGLDLGAREVAFCEVAQGRVVARRTASSLDGLKDLLGPEAAPARVAIESCREAWVVHDTLRGWGHDVLVVDTTRIQQIGIGHHGRKTDRIDAERLARAVERGSIPLAHVLSPHRRELREQLAVRRALVETRAQYVTTIRGLVRAHGEPLPRSASRDFVELVRRTSLSAATRALVTPLLVTLASLNLQIGHVDTQLEALCAQEPLILRLTTAPGVGLLVAAAFVSVVDDAKRFRDAHQVASYLGLVPREDTSGGRTHHRLGAITKHGNSYVRTLLVQGAWTILRTAGGDDPLQRWAHAVADRRGKRVAVIALARRLSGVLWAMWRDDSVYDAAQVGVVMARGPERQAQSSAVQAAAMRRAALKEGHRRRVRAKALGSPSTAQATKPQRSRTAA
jgi:transposase